MAKISKKDATLNYLRKHHTITPLEALNEETIRSMRLAALVNILRNEGYNITTTYGIHNGKRDVYATYVLEE